MNLNTLLTRRYATKQFDPERKIPTEQFAELENILRYSPSSTNLQPHHFIITDNDLGKQRIAQSAASGDYAYNTPKILNASHIIVLCSKIQADDAHLNQVLEQEYQDGRYADLEAKARYAQLRQQFVQHHRLDLQDEKHWHAKQTYIALGMLLFGAAALDIDAVAIEGADMDALNTEFGLTEQGFSAQVLVCLGYRHADDFNAKLPKSRLPKEVLITRV